MTKVYIFPAGHEKLDLDDRKEKRRHKNARKLPWSTRLLLCFVATCSRELHAAYGNTRGALTMVYTIVITLN